MARKRKKYPTDDNGQNALLQNMAGKAGTYSTQLGWITAEVTQLVEDAENFQLVLNYRDSLQNTVDAFYTFKETLLDGESDLSLDATPPDPDELTFPGHSRPGINTRTRKLIQKGFLGPAYTDEIGDDMDWLEDEGAGQFSPESLTAALKITANVGGEVAFEFSKQGTNGMRIEMQDSEGAWQHLADKSTSPATETLDGDHPRLVKFRGRLLYKDEPVGNYSPTYDIVTQP